MKGISSLLQKFRGRRSELSYNDSSVSFESFCGEVSPEKYSTKESSLDGDLFSSPLGQRPKKALFTNFKSKLGHGGKFNYHSLTIFCALFVLFSCLMFPVFLFLVPYLLQTGDNINSTATIMFDHLMIKHVESVPKILPPPLKPDYNQCKLIKEIDRFDCLPEGERNRDNCEARGCCWIPPKGKSFSDVPLATPCCFYAPNFSTYNYMNITQTSSGLTAFLKRNYRTAYPQDSEFIKMTVKFETESRLHVKITDPLVNRFEPPFPELPVIDTANLNLTYQLFIDPTKPGFQVIRKSDNTIIFDTMSLNNFIFSNQFLQISSKLPSQYIYGLGEHRTRFLLSTSWQQLTFWNHDGTPLFNTNLYGSHPFYMAMEESGKSHGVFLFNSNAMDVILQPTPAITFRPIGGVLDFYFFLGPTPRDVISQYTELIGRPYLPPYWGLGYHLCRFGYKTLNATKEIMQKNIDAGIRLDTQWNDLDYMNNSNDFTLDLKNFKELPQFIGDLHAKGMHYIPLVDPGISGSEPAGTYPPFDEGIKMDIFVKNSSNQLFIGKVWNTKSTVWPDFTHPNTVDYWTLMLRSMHNKVKFDGAWIDMNEPSNFLSGSFYGCPKNELESPPYVPGVFGGVLNHKTMCMSAKHYAGIHYNVHNLYGFTEAVVTSFAMSEIRGKRPMVISRATFPGHGHYAGHWSGDVKSEWEDMKYSIPQLLDFSLFGIPLMGADICGFNGNTTEALCNRWQQLGAFYPFSRNHNTDDGLPQDPASMGPLVVASTKKAYTIRYSLLPYLYTLFWKAHVNGETVSRPLLFEFPGDKNTYNIDTQFLWGPALMVLPVLEEGALSVSAYLPKGVWYDYYTNSSISNKNEGKNITLPAPLDTIPVLLRGGFVLPRQNPEQTTTKSRLNKINLLITADEHGNAYGDLYWDDGDSLNSYEEKAYSLISFEMQQGEIRSLVEFWGSENPNNLESITILGVQKPVSKVVVNNKTGKFTYNVTSKCLIIDELDENLNTPLVVTWN